MRLLRRPPLILHSRRVIWWSSGRLSIWWKRSFTRLRLVPILLGLIGACLLEGMHTRWRRLRRARPRLIWGPSAILNIKYASQAMRAHGYESHTCIDVDTTISAAGDFDRYADGFGAPGEHFVARCAMFRWVLRHGDVFMRYYDLGFLRTTPLRWLELPLMRIAGKKIVVSPYGGDIAVEGNIGIFEEALYSDYPELRGQSELNRRRILHTLRWANLVVRNYQHGYQPRFDVFWPTQVGIDERLWRGPENTSTADGKKAEVVVVHAPNHRAIKGTDHVLKVIRELRDEGMKIRLELLEKRSNEEVRRTIFSSDIVCEQLIGGYALFGIEGMAAGKPVLSNMSWVPNEMRTDSLAECPIVSTTPDSLREDLRRLAVDPALRGELGRAGREFVRRYHSLEALGREWKAIIEHVSSGDPLPKRLLPPPGLDGTTP